MSFLFGNKITARTPNSAEVAATKSRETAETRQKRIANFVPLLVAHVLDAIKQQSAAELKGTAITFDLPVMLGTGEGKALLLTNAFVNASVPLPSSAEMEFLAKEAKTKLEDVAAHGFTVDICAKDTCPSKGKMFTVDWSAPRVPAEPPKPVDHELKPVETNEKK
jgi:hypothetical protein